MKTILVVACEASADLHAANLIKQLKTLDPELNFVAVGSEKLKTTGAKLIFDAKKLSVMGLSEVFFKIPSFMKLFSNIISQIKKCFQNS